MAPAQVSEAYEHADSADLAAVSIVLLPEHAEADPSIACLALSQAPALIVSCDMDFLPTLATNTLFCSLKGNVFQSALCDEGHTQRAVEEAEAAMGKLQAKVALASREYAAAKLNFDTEKAKVGLLYFYFYFFCLYFSVLFRCRGVLTPF